MWHELCKSTQVQRAAERELAERQQEEAAAQAAAAEEARASTLRTVKPGVQDSECPQGTQHHSSAAQNMARVQGAGRDTDAVSVCALQRRGQQRASCCRRPTCRRTLQAPLWSS